MTDEELDLAQNEEEVEIEFCCPMCGEYHYMKLPRSLYERIIHRRENGEYIQDILKDYSPTDREKFLTGYCELCQEKVFGRVD